MTIKILLADDRFLILETIKAILEHEPEIEVVGTARDGQDAIAMAKKLRPDIVLIDIEMPKMNGILATKYICKYLPNIKVIVLTSHNSQDYIARALFVGASGYLLKSNLIEDLKQEIYSFGRGYSGIKAKLLSQTDQKNSTTNIVKYPEKNIYFGKYRKNLYKTAVNKKKHRQSRKTSNRQLTYPEISKANLGTISKTFNTKKIIATNLKTSRHQSVCGSLRFNRRKHLRRFIWLLLTILTLVFLIVIS